MKNKIKEIKNYEQSNCCQQEKYWQKNTATMPTCGNDSQSEDLQKIHYFFQKCIRVAKQLVLQMHWLYQPQYQSN